MATTAIWGIKGSLKQITDYVTNEDKTTIPEYESEVRNLNNLIKYAMSDEKTLNKNSIDDAADIQECFVSGINCSPEHSLQQMLKTKKVFKKSGGNIAYHGYQSFAENEVTPEQCHEIGTKLARKLWGDRFEVIVTTHLDKENHYHNHFLLNSVSFVDGKKYNDCKETYRLMRKTSDALCKEYGLSVIENPKSGQSKHYSEWKANAEGKPTWRSLVKQDVDQAIIDATSDRQFIYLLKQKGYEVKIGKDISVRPDGKERFVRLMRNFGEDYSIASIKERILTENSGRSFHRTNPTYTHCRNILKRNNTRKVGGLRGLYYHYLYKLGVFPKKKQSNARMHFLLKEDLLKLKQITEETRFISLYKIDTIDDLNAVRDQLNAEVKLGEAQRNELRNVKRSISDPVKAEELRVEISDLTGRIRTFRKKVKMTNNIEARSLTMKNKLDISKEEENRKEVKTNVQFR